MVDDQARAEVLREAARNHMRAARRHRRAGRRKMAELDEFIAACAQRGIRITINAKPEGGPSGNQNPHAEA